MAPKLRCVPLFFLVPFLLAVQVKHHRTERKAAVKEVREFHGVVTSSNSVFNIGVLVTNTSFTADAKWFAEQNKLLMRLHDLTDLCRWMQDDFLHRDEWREIPTEIELAPGVSIKIPKSKLWLRDKQK